jgi:hypothetical protein
MPPVVEAALRQSIAAHSSSFCKCAVLCFAASINTVYSIDLLVSILHKSSVYATRKLNNAKAQRREQSAQHQHQTLYLTAVLLTR